MLLRKYLNTMDNWVYILIGLFIGSIITFVALAVVRKDISHTEVDPEKEEAAKEWNQQSKGY